MALCVLSAIEEGAVRTGRGVPGSVSEAARSHSQAGLSGKGFESLPALATISARLRGCAGVPSSANQLGSSAGLHQRTG